MVERGDYMFCIPNVYIPKVFSECETVEMKINYLAKKYEELDERVTALEQKANATTETTN